MTCVADENVDRQIVDNLRLYGHTVAYIAELEPGIDDHDVLRRSLETRAVLITADKDFGEIVFRQRRATAGVLLLRLAGLDSQDKAARVLGVLTDHEAALAGAFSVVTPTNLRIRRAFPAL